MKNYFVQIEISPWVELKLNRKHGISGNEIKMTLIYGNDYATKWESHGVHGLRLIARGNLRSGRKFMAILQPINLNDGLWRLRTAWPIERKK